MYFFRIKQLLKIQLFIVTSQQRSTLLTRIIRSLENAISLAISFVSPVALSGLVRKKKIRVPKGRRTKKKTNEEKNVKHRRSALSEFSASQRKYLSLSQGISPESAIHRTRLLVQRGSVLYTEESKLILHGEWVCLGVAREWGWKYIYDDKDTERRQRLWRRR